MFHAAKKIVHLCLIWCA